MDIYNYYYIELNNGKYVFKRQSSVVDIDFAHKFTTRMQALSYAKKYFGDADFVVKGGGGIKEIPPYEY